MSTRMPKRLVAWLLAAMMALIVAPSAAFAEELTSGNLTAQDAPAWADIADDTVVFTVKAEQADGSVVAKDFTKSQMESMSQENKTPAKYAYSSKSGASLTVVTKYVTVDQLLAAAEVSFAENDTIIGSSDTFTPNSATPYEGFATRKFFPAYDPGKTEQNADGAEVTPAVIAIESGTVTLPAGTTAGDADLIADATAASAYQVSGKNAGLRNFWGKTEDELNDNMGGNSYCGGCTYLTVSTPFKVYTAAGNGERTLVKTYTKAQLGNLATNAAEPKDAKGFLFNKSGWQVGVTTSYIPIDTLMNDAGITLKDNMTVKASASDGFSSFMSYDQITNGKYFYPAATVNALSSDGQEEVGTVLALNWNTVTATPTAGEAKATAAANAESLIQQTRIFTGLRSVTDDQTGGNRFATGPVELTVITMKDVNDLSISGVEASYEFTGAAIEPAVVVKDGDTTLTAYDPEKPKKGGDYKVSYEDNTAVGAGKVIIEGMNGYMGMRAIEFKVAGIDISKATVTVADATYTGEALTPAVTVKLGNATLKAGTDYKVSYKNNTAVGTGTAVVEGIGNYQGKATGNFKVAGIDISKVTVTVAKATYTGKALKPAVTVKLGTTTLKAGTDYAVTYSNNKNAGSKAVATVTGKGGYAGTKAQNFTIAKAKNALVVKAVKGVQKVNYNKKKATAIASKNAYKVTKNTSKGKVTYKLTSVTKNGKSVKNKITVSNAGKITVKKATTKGVYIVKVNATSKGTSNYLSASKAVSLKVKVA